MSNNPFLPGQPTNYPSHDAFDASSRYPVIESSSPGPASPGPGYMASQPQWQPPQQFGYDQNTFNQLQQQWPQFPQYGLPQQQAYQQAPISPGLNGYPGGQMMQQPQYQQPIQQQPQQPQSYQPGFQQSQPTGYYPAQSPIYGGGQPQQQYQQPQQQFQPQQPPSQEILYLFDPHTSAASTALASAGGADRRHPKGYLNANKVRLEAWDKNSWSEFLATFETLKNAWAREATNYRNTEVQRNDAGNLASDVAASQIQMNEGYQGYKVSRDPTSKGRVRLAMNAALADLPDFPPGF